MTRYGLFIDGAWREPATAAAVTSPFSGDVAAHCGQATAADFDDAIAAADRDFRPFRAAVRGHRAALLAGMARGIEARRADFVGRMIREAGKPRTLAEVEVSRAVATFTAAAEEAKRLGGEVVPLDGEAAHAGYGPAISYWFAKSPVLAIAPFNFPLNLVAHKVAPALAVGAPVIVKPPPQAPGCAMLLAEIFAEARQAGGAGQGAIPRAALQVVPATNDVTGLAVTDPRLGIVSFTGSRKVGWMLQGMAVGKKTVLELGGNAAVIVNHDADLARAASRCAFGGFAYAGQVCISVQRILVQAAVEREFVARLLDETAKIRCGDPAAADVLCGPLIDTAAAERVTAWIEEAQARGGRVLAGGKAVGHNAIAPTVMTGVPRDLPLACEEVFGPVVLVETFADIDDAVRKANDSAYGLQAGVFTDSASARHAAVQGLEVGGIILDDVPTFRADTMPYGGVKASGLGREGVRYAMEDYCERRTVVPWNASPAR